MVLLYISKSYLSHAQNNYQKKNQSCIIYQNPVYFCDCDMITQFSPPTVSLTARGLISPFFKIVQKHKSDISPLIYGEGKLHRNLSVSEN